MKAMSCERNSERNNVLTPLLTLLILGIFTLIFAGTTTARAEEAPSPALTLDSSPAANSVLSQAPSMIIFHPTTALSGAVSARLLNSSGAVITEGLLNHIPDSPALALDVPHLPQGLYTTSWTSATSSGSFSFSISDSAPTTVINPTPSPKLKPLLEVILAWLPAISLMTFIGILFLLLVVVLPVSQKTATQVATRRLPFLAFAALTLFIPAFIAELSYNSQTSFRWQNLTEFFREEGSGTVFRVHIMLILIAWTITLVVLCYKRFQQRKTLLLTIATVAGMGALLCDRFPTSSRGNLPRTVFNFIMWIGHLGGSALWLGGLIGLLALTLPGGVSADSRKAFWIFAIRRFTLIATGAVALLVLSGLWLYWLHVGGFHQLISTLYGQTLSVKLIIFGFLLLLGAFNQFWLSPRLVESDNNTGKPSFHTLINKHFKIVVAAEVILALTVLLIAPFLAGSARNQEFQAQHSSLTQSASIKNAQVTFTPSGLQPGLTIYTIELADPTEEFIHVEFSSPLMGIGPHSVTATQNSAGRYTVTGFYTSVIGTWNATVISGSDRVNFPLTITEKAAPLPKSPAPQVRWTTWAAGIAETALVIIGCILLLRISGKRAHRHRHFTS